eukprot:TRINITY_DN773154_c0_g1_i1.p1 TRINITY_DN773154_c0_g1~~TRINITY_DN773154_c0_g1_i1.p1  ORF type:complete len:168 (+),score=66.11 TRINITY_DN773154_c0_g1_i1:224-727(+)
MEGVKAIIKWRPYLIRPDSDRAGKLYEGWAKEKIEIAKKDGANFENWKYWSNTENAHRLCRFAVEEEELNSNDVHELVFNEYYEQGRNISSVKDCIEMGLKLGLDETKLTAYMESEAGRAEVLRGDQMAKTMGIHGVPFFVFNKSEAFSGAQPKETFVDIINEVLDE